MPCYWLKLRLPNRKRAHFHGENAPSPSWNFPCKACLLHALASALLPGVPLRLSDEAQLVPGKPADAALNIGLRIRNGLRFKGLGDEPGHGILHEALAVHGHHIEFDPVGAAIRTKVRLILDMDLRHGNHLTFQYCPNCRSLSSRRPKIQPIIRLIRNRYAVPAGCIRQVSRSPPAEAGGSFVQRVR